MLTAKLIKTSTFVKGSSSAIQIAFAPNAGGIGFRSDTTDIAAVRSSCVHRPSALTRNMSSSDENPFQPDIAHGESVVDRKSVFQGHCAGVQQVEHVSIFLSKLKENKKIENAFHNMWAYRIDRSDPNARIAGRSASIVQDCDDDGEQAAGGRLLSLLQILNVVNVMVVVTRWYGGIQLGPARFKHINNAARDALVKGGFVQDGSAQAEGGTQSGNKAASKTKKKGKK